MVQIIKTLDSRSFRPNSKNGDPLEFIPLDVVYFEVSIFIWREKDLESCRYLKTFGPQRGFGNEVVSVASTLPQLRNKVEEMCIRGRW